MMRKEAAARYLGISLSTLERYMQQGKLPYRHERGRTRPIVVFDEDDLATFRAEREQAARAPSKPAAGAATGSISFRLEAHYWQRLEQEGRRRGLSPHETARWLVMMALEKLQVDVLEGHLVDLRQQVDELGRGLGRALAVVLVNLPEVDAAAAVEPREAQAAIERAMGLSLT